MAIVRRKTLLAHAAEYRDKIAILMHAPEKVDLGDRAERIKEYAELADYFEKLAKD